MGKDLIDIITEIGKENEKYFKNYLKYAKIIKKIVKNVFKEGEVIIFGSILKSKTQGDIDILIISDKVSDPEIRKEFFIQFNEKIGFINPFEIHFATKDQFDNWYINFIDKYIKV